MTLSEKQAEQARGFWSLLENRAPRIAKKRVASIVPNDIQGRVKKFKELMRRANAEQDCEHLAYAERLREQASILEREIQDAGYDPRDL